MDLRIKQYIWKAQNLDKDVLSAKAQRDMNTF